MPSHTAAGFSLIELMVAITLSLLLLTGVVAIFSSSRANYETTNQLSRVQETGRFALEQLSRQVRSAGFAGCARVPNFVSTALNNATALPWNFLGGPVRGFNGGATAFTPSLDGTGLESLSLTAGSDVLVVRGARLESEPTQVTADMANPQSPLTVATTNGIRTEGDVVMAYNCEAQAFFYAVPSGTSLTHGVTGTSPGNAVASTSYPFRMNDEVVPVETVIYYVAPSIGAPEDSTLPAGTPPTLPAGTRSLYRRGGLDTADELVQGVDQMQVEYGIDNNNDRIVDIYSVASATTDWQRVIAVRVALLVRSIDQYGADTDRRTYQLLNAAPVTPPGDRRLREIFTATVSIRNRVRVD
jgi:type IV pilus assembly protein PilW